MGQAKKLMMEHEYNLSILDSLIVHLSNNEFDYLHDNQIVQKIKNIQETIFRLDLTLMSNIDFVGTLFTDKFRENSFRLVKLLDSVESKMDVNERFEYEFTSLIKIIRFELSHIELSLQKYLTNSQNIYNSEDYYHEQIKELEEQKEKLELFLKHQRDIDGASKEEIENHKNQVKEKEIALKNANNQIKNLQKELEVKKKQENAVDEWNNKIKSAFAELTKCLAPIKNEHFRLNLLFWIYSGLMIIILLIIVSLEINTFCKLNNTVGPLDWDRYLASIIPIPIFGGLFWAFIIQANRTQRQLVILAKHIHEIRYIEGLLLTINTLSPDINDSTKRVNIAIDRLLENHLKECLNNGDYREENILAEENKDSVPIDIVLKLIKEAKGIISK
ncbi:MAG: hypothetical protein CVU05_06490 [Bacteroidetes bacterium HGW-Bacteroidetes-21]|jgi:hypothetical protein|nr:MAG: hypothetical protein CVU05_06490 [Bacteroidetes bacterium HGW-Bacteroidetes-21]